MNFPSFTSTDILLKIVIPSENTSKTIRVETRTKVGELLEKLKKKIFVGSGGDDFGLYWYSDSGPLWLADASTLKAYNMKNGDSLEYKKRPANLNRGSTIQTSANNIRPVSSGEFMRSPDLSPRMPHASAIISNDTSPASMSRNLAPSNISGKKSNSWVSVRPGSAYDMKADAPVRPIAASGDTNKPVLSSPLIISPSPLTPSLLSPKSAPSAQSPRQAARSTAPAVSITPTSHSTLPFSHSLAQAPPTTSKKSDFDDIMDLFEDDFSEVGIKSLSSVTEDASSYSSYNNKRTEIEEEDYETRKQQQQKLKQPQQEDNDDNGSHSFYNNLSSVGDTSKKGSILQQLTSRIALDESEEYTSDAYLDGGEEGDDYYQTNDLDEYRSSDPLLNSGVYRSSDPLLNSRQYHSSDSLQNSHQYRSSDSLQNSHQYRSSDPLLSSSNSDDDEYGSSEKDYNYDTQQRSIRYTPTPAPARSSSPSTDIYNKAKEEKEFESKVSVKVVESLLADALSGIEAGVVDMSMVKMYLSSAIVLLRKAQS